MKALKTLSKKHWLLIDMMVGGNTHQEITAALGYKKQTYYALRTDPLIALALEETRREARSTSAEILRAATLDAIRYLKRAVASGRPVDAVGVKAAIDILNRVDLGSATMAKSETNILAIGINYTDDEIIEMLSMLPTWMLDKAKQNQ
jgi:hypothetical protein